MIKAFSVVVALALASAAAVRLPGNPLTSDVKTDFASVRDFVVRSAEKMPAQKYSFKPSPDVRTFAQQLAHIADDQYNLCAGVRGETRKDAYTAIEQSLSKKDELVPALKAAFDYCQLAYDNLTDANGAGRPASGKRTTNFAMLNWNLWHTWEHYGNIVVYLRINGLVPPSSTPAKK